MNTNTYYYNQVLNKEQRKTYYAIKEGLLSLAPSIVAPIASAQDLSNIYFMIRMDYPEIFYTNTFKYRMYEDSSNIEIFPVYMFEKKKIQEHRAAMKSRVAKLARQAEKLDDAGKLEFIHNFICENVTYDKLKKAYSHEIIGALGNGVAVCEGISKAVKILCDALGVWCTIAVSQANPERGIKYRHAWNVVKLGGKYYHIDATFDNSVSRGGALRYDYMCLSDSQISRDHEAIIWRVPECSDNSRSYYREKKLSFTKMEDVYKRSLQAAKKGRVLTFHWRGGYMSKEVFEEILEQIKAAGDARAKVASVRVNWPQAVISLSYSDCVNDSDDSNDFDSALGGGQVEMQEANEGELYDGEVN